MKLTDFLTDVGRPVAYYPELKKITGSTTATILLCQFIYWRGKESDPDGWLYKVSDDIEKETGLSYEEQKTARKKLLENDLIEEHYARLDHQMKFRLKLDNINLKWGKLLSPVPEQGNATMGKKAMPQSLNESETTAKNTTENTYKRGDLVDGVIELSQMPGVKKSIRLDGITSRIAVRLSLNPSGRKWEDFVRYVDDREQKDKESLDTFMDWLVSQKGFDVSFWPPDKMRQHWPRAFNEAPLTQPKGVTVAQSWLEKKKAENVNA